jgi:hypothetical protein
MDFTHLISFDGNGFDRPGETPGLPLNLKVRRFKFKFHARHS